MNHAKGPTELVESPILCHGTLGLGLAQPAAIDGLQILADATPIFQGTFHKYVPRQGTLRAAAWLDDVDASVASATDGKLVLRLPFAENSRWASESFRSKPGASAIEIPGCSWT